MSIIRFMLQYSTLTARAQRPQPHGLGKLTHECACVCSRTRSRRHAMRVYWIIIVCLCVCVCAQQAERLVHIPRKKGGAFTILCTHLCARSTMISVRFARFACTPRAAHAKCRSSSGAAFDVADADARVRSSMSRRTAEACVCV